MVKAARLSSSAKDIHPAEEAVIARALSILRAHLKDRTVLSSSEAVQSFLRLQSARLPHEIFSVLHLDTHNRLLSYDRLFRGTLSRTSVYPREVVKQALAINAASVILHHNHPAGLCTPSPEDIAVTSRLRDALALVDIRVLDHVITSDAGAFSMAAHGLI